MVCRAGSKVRPFNRWVPGAQGDHKIMDQRLQSGLGFLQRWMRQGGIAALALLLAACAGSATRTPAAATPAAPTLAVDMQKFGGQWYLIAHVPYAGERDQLDSSIELRPRVDGGFDELYRYFDNSKMQSLVVPRSRYVAVAGSNNTRWVSHLRSLDSQMNLDVLYVDPDYRYAVVGESRRDLGWIYARDPAVDPATYQNLVAQLSQHGYQVAQLHRLSHSQVLVGNTRLAVP